MNENDVIHKITLTDDLRNKISKKLKRFDRLFPEDTKIKIKLESAGNDEITELTIFDKDTIFRAEVKSDSVLTALDEAIDTIERQIRKNKTKLEKRFRGEGTKEFFDEDCIEEEEFRITKHKKFEFNPMTAEEAILQMNLLGHQFYIFNDIDTNGICVVYKKKNNEYGIIEEDK